MNESVLTLTAIVSLAAGLLIYRLYRHSLAATAIPLAAVAAVAMLLPWKVQTDRQPAPKVAQPQPPQTTMAALVKLRPTEVPSDGYVASDACRECHTENHATWHASYHRTMTQIATPQTVQGDFHDVLLSDEGHQYHLQSDGETCWANIPMSYDADSERTSVPIVMTTGSHHMQAYWFATGRGRTVGILPFVYWNETQEWIPRAAAFLKSYSDPSYELGRWSSVCSQCHSTHRRERLQGDRKWDTQVAEFGISCEACHGPGQQHIDYHSAPSDSPAKVDLVDTIVNPANLSKERSSQVCGQCHSVNLLVGEEGTLNEHGHAFRPGRDLHESHQIMQRSLPEQLELLDENFDADHQLNQTYFRDGMVRVSGREYNGLVASACYTQGEMTCLSCHQMHKSASDSRSLTEWSNDQLRPESLGDGTCLSCHTAEQYAANHTHHQVGSTGSKCYNCHMPHTTYGLLKAIRSHTISSPDVGKDIEAGRPNACNLCHLDKTLKWTADHLHDWYDIDPPELETDQIEIAASLLWLLNGDAAERALASWNMGWLAAQEVSGTTWLMPFLAQMLDDPYPAIRLIARRSLRTLDGLKDLQVDPFASQDRRRDAISAIAQYWYENPSSSTIQRSELLFGIDGIQADKVQRLMLERDNTPIFLAE